MSDNKYISWTSFCQAMNSIAYWLLQNKKNYKKRDHYQILTLKGSCNDIEKKAKKLGNNKLVAMYTMALIKDNKSLDFLPNYVTLKNGTQIDKAEYVDMAIRTEAYIRANKRLPAIVYRMSKLPDYKDSTMKLFTKTFNFKGNTIDEALAVISKKELYSKYFLPKHSASREILLMRHWQLFLKRNYTANTSILRKLIRKPLTMLVKAKVPIV